MTPSQVTIFEDNDLSRRIQEILSHEGQTTAVYKLRLLTTSRYRYFPQNLMPAAIAGLIAIDEFCASPNWYRQRNVYRLQQPFDVTDPKSIEDTQCYIDCRRSGVRIIYHRNPDSGNDLVAGRADEIAELIPLVKANKSATFRSTSAFAILLAFSLKKAGKDVSFVTEDSPWIDRRLDSEIQVAIRSCIENQGINLTGSRDCYPQISVKEDNQEFHLYGHKPLCDQIMSQLQVLRSSGRLQTTSLGRTPCHYLIPDNDPATMDVLSMSSTIDGTMRKAWIEDNQVKGFFFLGDVSGSGIINSLIANSTDISAIRHQLLFVGL